MARNKLKVILELIDKMSGPLGGVNSKLNAFSGQVQSTESALGKLGKTIATGALVMGIGKLIKDSTVLAARVETLGIVTTRLGKNVGYTEPQIRALEQSIVDQGITMQKSREMIAMMIQSNVDLAHSTKLARLAQDAAVIANMDSSEAAKNLVYILQTGNVRMARTLGLNLSFEKSYAAMAQSIGVTTDALSQEQIMQARVNAVMEAGINITGVYDAAMGTAGKNLTSLPRHIEEFKVSLGKLFIPALSMAVEGLTKFFKTMREGLDILDLLIHKEERIAEAYNEHEQQVFNTAETYNEYATEMERAKEAAGRFGEDLTYLTEKEYINEQQMLATSAGYALMREQMEMNAAPAKNLAYEVDNIAESLKNMGAQSTSAVQQMIKSFEDAWTDLQAGGPQIRQDIANIQKALLEGKITPEQAEEMIAQLYVAYEKNVADIEGREVNLWNMAKAIRDDMGVPFQEAYDLVKKIWKMDGKTIRYSVHVDYTETMRRQEETRRQHGGPLPGGLAKVGEAGWEYIWNGVVIPHHMSKQLERLGMGRGARGFQFGGLTTYTGPTFSEAMHGMSAYGGGLSPKTPEFFGEYGTKATSYFTGGGGASATQVAAAVAAQATEAAVQEAIVGAIQPEVTQQTIAMTSSMQATRLETLETNKLLRQVVGLLSDMPTTDEQRQIQLEAEDTSGW